MPGDSPTASTFLSFSSSSWALTRLSSQPRPQMFSAKLGNAHHIHCLPRRHAIGTSIQSLQLYIWQCHTPRLLKATEIQSVAAYLTTNVMMVVDCLTTNNTFPGLTGSFAPILRSFWLWHLLGSSTAPTQWQPKRLGPFSASFVKLTTLAFL